MEEAFLRFPHLSERIFDSLDDKSLTDCKGVSNSWYDYLIAQKFLETRIIQSIDFKLMTFKRVECPMCTEDFVEKNWLNLPVPRCCITSLLHLVSSYADLD